MDELRALAERAEATDGHAPFSDDLWQHALAGRIDVALVAGPDSGGAAPKGVAFAGSQGTRRAAELLVDPEARGQGYGAALLTELLSSVDDELWIWSHGDHPAARALAARHDLVRARELLQLRRPASAPVPETIAPEGITVRTFVPGQDEAAWVSANAAAFSWHPEQGSRTLADIRAAEAEPWFDPEGFFIAVDPAGDVAGFHWTKCHPPAPDLPEARPVGEVYVLGVIPRAQGSGLGAHLTALGLAHLASVPGVDEIMLYVEGDNAPALKVYERLGFRRHSVDVAYRRRA
nr:mycothiol synthase [Phytoactinopolyspora mesophila]